MNTSKRVLISILFVVLFASCTTVKFNRFTGERLSSFPEEMLGFYLLPHTSKTNNDSIHNYKVSIQSTKVVLLSSMNDSILDELAHLDSNLVLTKSGKYYFLNSPQNISNEFTAWDIVPLMVEKNTIYLWYLNPGQYAKSIQKKFTAAPQYELTYKMNDLVFMKWCTKNLKKRHAHKLSKWINTNP